MIDRYQGESVRGILIRVHNYRAKCTVLQRNVRCQNIHIKLNKLSIFKIMYVCMYVCNVCMYVCMYVYVCMYIQVSQEECARLREGVPYVKVYRYNPKHLCPKLNGYGDNGQRSLKL